MRVPLFIPIDDPSGKVLKRTSLDFSCFGPCQRKGWNVNQSSERYLPDIKKQNPTEMPEAGCKNLKRLFPFPDEPATEEELQFPLAYGILVYKSPLQVFLLMSAIYQPQNAYCLAVDDRADEQFKKQMNLFMDCFPNIFTVNKVEWCEFGVVRGVFNCLRYLSEMVRIFKRLNGTINAEILPFEASRIVGSQVFMKSPLTLWKSSLSGSLMSRETVNAIISSNKVRQQLNYLKFGYCSDEVSLVN
uniref:Uncharacterized protein n=1 Tax=Meloidogyne javanica TaxID=6303 RepID=A0A915MXA4_MELJA